MILTPSVSFSLRSRSPNSEDLQRIVTCRGTLTRLSFRA
jgi:hypothetical protein